MFLHSKLLILLCSLTTTGLEKLFDITAGYIQKEELNFNVTKPNLWFMETDPYLHVL